MAVTFGVLEFQVKRLKQVIQQVAFLYRNVLWALLCGALTCKNGNILNIVEGNGGKCYCVVPENIHIPSSPLE